MYTEQSMTYLLGRVPHNVLDVLCVRVHDSNALVLVFFIHWETQMKRKHLYYKTLKYSSIIHELTSFCELDSSHDSEVVTRTEASHEPSQTQTLLSLLHVASRFPEGAQATHFTSFSCPSNTVRLWGRRWDSGENLQNGAALHKHFRALNISSYLKVVVLLFPDACGGIEAGRCQIVSTGRPGHLPHGALVPILKHSLTNPRVTWKMEGCESSEKFIVFTSTKSTMNSPLSVCFSAGCWKTEQISTQLGGRTGHGPRRNPLKLVSGHELCEIRCFNDIFQGIIYKPISMSLHNLVQLDWFKGTAGPWERYVLYRVPL